MIGFSAVLVAIVIGVSRCWPRAAADRLHAAARAANSRSWAATVQRPLLATGDQPQFGRQAGTVGLADRTNRVRSALLPSYLGSDPDCQEQNLARSDAI
jgi:hypothetical protein